MKPHFFCCWKTPSRLHSTVKKVIPGNHVNNDGQKVTCASQCSNKYQGCSHGEHWGADSTLCSVSDFSCFFKFGNKLFSRGRVKIDPAAVRMRVVFTKTRFPATRVVGIIYGCPCISLDIQGCLQPSMDFKGEIGAPPRLLLGAYFTMAPRHKNGTKQCAREGARSAGGPLYDRMLAQNSIKHCTRETSH